MRLNKQAIITISRALLTLGAGVLVSNHALAADCTAVSGTTATITANCRDLEISGDSSNITINSDIIVDAGANNANDDNAIVNTVSTTNTTITNNGKIRAGHQYGVRNSGHITELFNSGVIKAGYDEGGHDPRFNRNSAVINEINKSITLITNTGTFKTFNNFGLKNSGIITTLTNSGTIQADYRYGIQNKGAITTLTNSGTIKAIAAARTGYVGGPGDGSYGLQNHTNKTITTLTNSGTISADTDNGLRNNGAITTLTNSGTISAGTKYGLYNSVTITTLTNSGTISAGTNYAIANTGSIETLTNTDSITTAGAVGISNNNAGSITTFNNSQGQLSSSPVTFKYNLPTNYNVIVNSTSDFGKIVFSSVSGTTTFGVDSSSTLANDTTYSSVLSGLSSGDIASGTSGTINSSDACSDVSGTTTTISANCADLDISGTDSNVTINSGVAISGEGDKNWTLNNSSGTLWDLVVSDDDDVVNTGTGTVITNSGTISAGDDNGLLNATNASITTLTNSGTITAADDYGLYNAGAITTLTNTGTISASGNNIGIYNSSPITTLNNSQGAFGSALTFDGTLPINYNVIVNSTSDFGKIVFSSVSGTTTFGVDSSSTLANDTTYSSVLSGLSSGDIASGTSGTINSSDACSDVSGTTTTISANCADLDISGTDSNVTINSGVAISGEGDKNWTLNNSSGTLWDLVVSDDDDVVNTGTGTVITNSGTISAGDDNGLLNATNASITTLTNSGTITAADDYGLYNAGAITTLTNTGTISASGNNIGIYNSSPITTLNNSQGAFGSALTFDGTLPINYNVIVNSTSDFGKIVFSSVSGTTTFGVDSSSTLADVNTTYSSVLSGLSSGDIASGTSGTFGVSGSIRKDWTLDNSSGSLWDLNVTVIDITNELVDTDSDGVSDNMDNCPSTSNSNQLDTDGDGSGDACDSDDDNDGVPDSTDKFPLNASDSVDTDNDGMGDNYETTHGLNPLNPSDASLDNDGDGLTNLEEFQAGRNPTLNEGGVIQIINSILLDE